MKVDCVGCGAVMEMAGTGTLCYTCGCGSTVFFIDGSPAPPASLVLKMKEYIDGKNPEFPHLEYYLGTGAYMDDRKKQWLDFLVKRGSKWSWECVDCRDKTVLRFIGLVEGHMVDIKTLHPDLKRAMVEKSPLVRW